MIKIQKYREVDLTTLEKRVVRTLLVERADGADVNTASDGIVERALKRIRTSMTAKKSECMYKMYLSSMSNCCRRPFSISGYALSNSRCGILPMNFESQMFLYMNDKYWDIGDVKILVSEKYDPDLSKD